MKTLRSQPVSLIPEVPKPDLGKFPSSGDLLKTNCNCKGQEIHSWDNPKCKMYIPFTNGDDGFSKKETEFTFRAHREPIKHEEEVLVRCWNKAILKNALPFHDMMDSGCMNLEQAKLLVKALEEAGYWIIERDF